MEMTPQIFLRALYGINTLFRAARSLTRPFLCGLGLGMLQLVGAAVSTDAAAQSPQSVTRTTYYSYAPSVTVNTSNGSYDPNTVLPIVETIEPNASTDCQYCTLEYNFSYDVYGNLNAVMKSGVGVPTNTSGNGYTGQISFTNYDSTGLYQANSSTAVPNGGGATNTFTTTPTFEPVDGHQVTSKDPNGLVTTSSYDPLGRLTSQVRPDGNWTSVVYGYCSGPYFTALPDANDTCPSGASYWMEVTPKSPGPTGVQNGERVITFYDALDRLVRREGQVIASEPSLVSATYTNTSYSAVGDVASTTRPYFSSGLAYTTTYAYDALHRPTAVTHPDGSFTTTAYTGLTITTTDENGHTTAITRDQIGEVVQNQTPDPANPGNPPLTTSFQYEPFGNITRIMDAIGNQGINGAAHQTNASYNNRGWRTTLSDPDTGNWSYQYDALGELAAYTDANGQQVSFNYDVLGRKTAENRPDVSNYWGYDQYPGVLGKLHAAVTMAGGTILYQRQQYFDSLARLHQVQTIPTLGNRGTGFLSTTINYDSNGRVSTVSRPSGLTLGYGYDSIGAPYYLYNPAGFKIPSGVAYTYWAVQTHDAEGRSLAEVTSNYTQTQSWFDAGRGWPTAVITRELLNQPTYLTCTALTWQTNGLVATRSNLNANSNAYAYDSLNRLTGVNQGAPPSGCAPWQLPTSWPTVEMNLSYDAIGNVLSKTGPLSISFTYDPTHAHRLYEAFPAGGGFMAYGYYNNGNPIVEHNYGSVLPYTNFAYNSGNLIQEIAQGNTDELFTYDESLQRASMRLAQGSTISTTYYVGFDPLTHSEMHFAGTDPAAGVTPTWVDYLDFAGKMIGTVTTKASGTVTDCAGNQVASPMNSFFHTDHQGSIIAISCDATASTNAFLQQSYDSWGRRRLANLTPDSVPNTITSPEHRGYIGEEELDTIGLINLNRRLYDPLLGRFLSADPIAHGFFANPQGLNRYAYAGNAPTSFSDPSGFARAGNNDGGAGPDDSGFGSSGGYSASDVSDAISSAYSAATKLNDAYKASQAAYYRGLDENSHPALYSRVNLGNLGLSLAPPGDLIDPEPLPGTPVLPYNEFFVPLQFVPRNAITILQYREMFLNPNDLSWSVGFHFPLDSTIMDTYARRGPDAGTLVSGLVVSPPDAPDQISGSNPISSVRVTYNNAYSGAAAFQVYNGAGQTISPVTGQTVGRSDSHYPLGGMVPW